MLNSPLNPAERPPIDARLGEPGAREAPHLLMCPPDHFGIEYEINPWMDRARQSDHATACGEWRALHELLRSLGARISLIEPKPGLPDLVFTANAALVFRRQAILSRFRHPQRQGEESIDEAWFSSAGFELVKLPEGMSFEGAGDALFCGENLFAGYRTRSHARSLQYVAAHLGVRVFPLEMARPRFYHLDTCFCPISATQAIYYPAAFDDYGRTVLAQYVDELISVDDDEAAAFACNAVVVGRHVVTNVGCPRLHERLAERDFTPHSTPLGEFLKAGGAAKCLTLRLDGEEAAAWASAATGAH